MTSLDLYRTRCDAVLNAKSAAAFSAAKSQLLALGESGQSAFRDFERFGMLPRFAPIASEGATVQIFSVFNGGKVATQ